MTDYQDKFVQEKSKYLDQRYPGDLADVLDRVSVEVKRDDRPGRGWSRWTALALGFAAVLLVSVGVWSLRDPEKPFEKNTANNLSSSVPSSKPLTRTKTLASRKFFQTSFRPVSRTNLKSQIWLAKPKEIKNKKNDRSGMRTRPLFQARYDKKDKSKRRKMSYWRSNKKRI